MRSHTQSFELKLKKLGLVTLLGCGLCFSAYAQTAPLSLPSLPPLPGMPVNPANPPSPSAAPAIASLPAPSELLPATEPAEATQPLPELSELTKTKGSETPIPNIASTAPPPEAEAAAALPSLGALPLPELATGESESTTLATDDLPPIPQTLPLPAPATADSGGFTSLPIAIPEIRVVREKKKVKTWQTKLAPSITPPQTGFNYKRQLLPQEIYRADYDRENRHLPARYTQEQYASLLFASIAQNDVEATRAMLNAGANLRMVNGYGETPLAFARRQGAMDVAALLTARGVR